MLQRKIVDGKHCYQKAKGPLFFYTPGDKASRDNAKGKAMQFGLAPRTVESFFKHSKNKKTGSGKFPIWSIPSYSALHQRPPANSKVYEGNLGGQHG